MVTGNTAAGSGGGIMNSGALTLNNVTISSNIGGGWLEDGYSYTSGTLRNTILAGNSPNNCFFSKPLTSAGFNLSSDLSCIAALNTLGDRNHVDPLLGSLADNGGSTMTHALQTGSPAIDGGTNSDCPATDQRSIVRPMGDRCDIGAYEFVSQLYLPLLFR